MPERRISKLTPAWTMIGVALLLSGCGTDSRSVPSPTPSFSCTPDPAGAPCTAELAAAQAEESKAYAEAEFAYREFTKERSRVAMAGGSANPTPTMEKYASGQYLADVSEFLAAGYSGGVSPQAPLEIIDVRPRSYSGGNLELAVCEDGTHSELVDRNGRVLGVGSRGLVLLKFNRIDGQWKVLEGTSLDGESC